MPGPLIALATGLGIRNAAKYTYKQLQKLITKAQKQKKSKQTKAEKGYKGKGAKRKEEKVTQRKKDEKWELGVRGRSSLSHLSIGVGGKFKG